MQLLQIQARQIPHLDVLEMLPATALVKRAQIRSIAGKDFQVDVFCAASSQVFPNFSPTMDGRTIPNDQQLRARLTQQMLQKFYAVRARQRLLPNQGIQLSRWRYTRHDRKMVATLLLGKHRCQPLRAVSSDHTRQQVEARFIDKNQGPALFRSLPPQPRPYLGPPTLDSFFVALNSPSQRNLWRPSQAFQQARNMVFVVDNAELPLNDLDDTRAGPNVTAKTIRFRTVPQKLRKGTFLRCRQLGRMPRRGMGQQSISARRTSNMHPMADSSLGRSQGNGDVLLLPAALLQFPRSQSSPFFPVVGIWLRSSHIPILRETMFTSLRRDQ